MRNGFRSAVVAGTLTAVVTTTGVESGATAKGGSCEAERAAAARDLLAQVRAGWAAGDADAIAAVMAADASMIVPGEDTYLTSREEIRQYFENILAGPFEGVRATADILDVKCVGRSAGVVITQGGLLFPGETVVPPERVGRQTWVIVKQGHEWAVTAYQNSRITSG